MFKVDREVVIKKSLKKCSLVVSYEAKARVLSTSMSVR